MSEYNDVVFLDLCDQCTKELDDKGDCFECGTGVYARDCSCGQGDWLCPWHQRGEPCQGGKPVDDDRRDNMLLADDYHQQTGRP